MYRTVNNIKYTLFKLNKDTGYRLSGLSTFKHPIFFTFINKVNHDYGVYGQNIEINKISDGEYEINPYVLAEYKNPLAFKYKGQDEVSFGLNRNTSQIIFYCWVVWDNLPTLHEYMQLTIKEKGTTNYIEYRGKESRINTNILQPLYLAHINVPDEYYDKDLILEIKAINNGIFDMFTSHTKFFLNVYAIDNLIPNDLEVTVLVVEGDGNVENQSYYK